MSDTVLPVGRAYSRAHVDSNFNWYGEFPHAWGQCRYLVPRTWTGAGGNTPSAALIPGDTVEIGFFTEPGGSSQITVRVLALQRETSAELLLRYQLINLNAEPQALTVLSGLFADSLSLLQGPLGATQLRLAVRLHGNLAFLISGSSTSAAYAGLAETFGVFIASFKPTAEPPQATIEDRLPVDVGGVVSFVRPASWRMREVPPLPGKYATDLIAINNDVPTGMMRVKTCSKALPTRADRRVDEALAEWAEAGFTSGKRLVNRQIETGARFSGGLLQVLEGKTLMGMPQELWIIVAQDDGHDVTVSLLTPDRRTEFLAWTWNRAALDIVTASLS